MPRRKLLNVARVDHHHFHGWHVCLKRAGQRHERYFHDRRDARAALARALAWRDRMAATLPPPRKFHRTSSLNTTGIVGVHLARQRTRKGTLVRYYTATWVDERGRPVKRVFSVAKYGEWRAFALAAQARRQALAEMLRPACRRAR
jgi:hypothetical protein